MSMMYYLMLKIEASEMKQILLSRQALKRHTDTDKSLLNLMKHDKSLKSMFWNTEQQTKSKPSV